MRRSDRLPINRLTQAHAAAGCAKHQRQVLLRLPTGLFPGLMSCVEQQPGSAVHPAQDLPAQQGRRQSWWELNLGCHLDALAGNIKRGDWPKRGMPLAKPLCILLPAATQGSDYARAGDDDTRRAIGVGDERK